MAYFNVVKRQQRIIQLIRRHQPDLQELIDLLAREGIENCSRRTIQRDLEDIRIRFGLNIVFNKQLRIYNLVEDQKQGIDAIYDFIDRATVSESISKRLFDGKKAINQQYIITDSPLFDQSNSGIHHFDPLLFACIEKRVVGLTYRPKYQRDNLKSYTVYPLALKEFRHRWYLLCQASDTLKFYTLALDRIEDAELTGKKLPNKGLINPEKIYESVYGITNPDLQEPVFILIKTTKSYSEYMKSIPWHSSQKIIAELENHTVFEFYLKPNFEFIQLILMQGSDVCVLEPSFLRKSIQDTIKSMAENYR
jgi:predicted DNA-binding transcriptional regulator YafY